MKSVLITGCSNGGIGSAIAKAFQRRGFVVFATARNPQKMSDLEHLQNVEFIKLDVTDASQIKAAVEAVSTRTNGTLDYLVNNAGQNRYMPVLDDDIEEAKKLFETNFWGSVAVTQAFAPLVIKAKGTIVSISSMAGQLDLPYLGVYGASKKALELVTDTLRLELAPFGVKCVSVVTGAVGTQGNSHLEYLKLPEDSLYKSIEDSVLERARWNDGVKRQSADVYAENVVAKVTGGANGQLWLGSMASTCWWLLKLTPTWLLDTLLTPGHGLEKIGNKKA